MNDSNEMFISQEDRDPERLEGILRHSQRRQDTPVMLVQLPNVNPEPPNSEVRPSQRHATIVNTAGASGTDPLDSLDPIEWHFLKNTPDLRTSLVQERALDELCSQRKSRVGGGQMEQMVLMMSNQNMNRYPLAFDVEEYDNNTRETSKTGSNIPVNSTRDKNTRETSKNKRNPPVDNTHDNNTREISKNRGTIPVNNTHDNNTHETSKGRSNMLSEDGKPQNSTSAPTSVDRNSTMVNEKKTENWYTTEMDESEKRSEPDSNREPSEIGSIDEESLPAIDAIMSSFMDLDRNNKENTSTTSEYQFTNQKSPLKEGKSNPISSKKDAIVMKAEYSHTDMKSPFKDTKMKLPVNLNKEITIMPAQYTLADQETPFKKDRDEIRPRPSSRVRVLIMVDELDQGDSFEDENRGKRYEGDGGRKGRGRGQLGRKPDDWDPSKESMFDETRSEFVSDKSPLKDRRNDKSGRRGRPNDDDYDRYKNGEGSKRGRKPGYRGDDWDDKDNQSGRSGGPYGKNKYGDGSRGGDGYSDGFDGDDRSKRGRRPGDDKRKYGDGSNGPDKGFDGDGRDKRDGRGEDKNRRGRPGGENDLTKYRLVTMPKSATTLSSKRRYHIQVTDHEMKEPWFNSCFNISKENNVDLSYEGPVKITPYYVGDKFS